MTPVVCFVVLTLELAGVVSEVCGSTRSSNEIAGADEEWRSKEQATIKREALLKTPPITTETTEFFLRSLMLGVKICEGFIGQPLNKSYEYYLLQSTYTSGDLSLGLHSLLRKRENERSV
jgi:hypothetical protein